MGWRRAGAALSNARRRLVLKRLPDYLTFTLDRTISDLAAPSPWWMRLLPTGSPPLSLQTLAPLLRHVADDPDVQGIVFIVKSPALSRVTAQNLAALLERFRTWDAEANPGAPPKRIVVWSETVDASVATAFSAADALLLAPQGGWEVAGVRVERLYLRDALARAGVSAEVVKVAPWKTAADALTESRMSDAEREQIGWLLDSLYDQLVQAIARGRKLPADAVRAQIDQSPLAADEALAAGLVDATLYEDEIAGWLATHSTRQGTGELDGAQQESAPQETASPSSSAPVRIKRYAEVAELLYRRVRPRSAQAIGLIDLRGAIVTGESRSFPIPLPLLGGDLMGSSTVQQVVRAARRQRDLAAVVVRIDSGGGSAAASDLMWRELQLLAREKPLVIYMAGVAASGGYYIAVPGQAIVAQAGTLTGSIGVVLAKVITEEAYARAGAHRDSVEPTPAF
jgi:protease-4